MIEVGRHMKPKLLKEQRICQLCNHGVEDEIHFLVECESFDPLRKPLLDTCTELRSQFNFYTHQEKFIFIMTTPLLMDDLSKFIHVALEERDMSLEVKATLEKVLDKVSKSAPSLT